MTDGVISLAIPAQPEYLSLVRAVVAAAAALDPGLGDERIEDLRIAVSEATTNAIEAHANLGSKERITIRCDLEEDRIEVEVQDHAVPGFDPAGLVVPGPLDEPGRLDHEGGFGIPLMRVLADEMNIRSLEHGTAVQLVVYASPNRKD
ncbi:MAG: ATP-binding protein [Acidimicrobiales bacterium]